jgi:hypothetical protein
MKLSSNNSVAGLFAMLLTACGADARPAQSPQVALATLSARRCLLNGVELVSCRNSSELLVDDPESLPLPSCHPAAVSEPEAYCESSADVLLAYEVLGYAVIGRGYSVAGLFLLCCAEDQVRADPDRALRWMPPHLFPLAAPVFSGRWTGAVEFSTFSELTVLDVTRRQAMCPAESAPPVWAGATPVPLFRRLWRVAHDPAQMEGLGVADVFLTDPAHTWVGNGLGPPWCR